MTDRDDALASMLSRIRQLQADRDHAGVLDALEGLDRGRLLAEPALGYALAVAYHATGRPADAYDLAGALRAPCARRGRDRLYRRRLNLEAALEFERGALDRAAELWQDLLNQATEANDSELVAKASNNLGILHTLGDRPWEALSAYSRALVANQRLGDRRGLAQAHQNLAITFREAGLYREADTHFREALAHAQATDAHDVLGRAEEERALLFLLKGDPGMAEVSAQRALRLFQGIGDAAGQAETIRVLGLVALSEGRMDVATTRLHDALERSRDGQWTLLEAETTVALAGLQSVRGRPEEADRLVDAANRIFQRMGAEAWGAHTRRRVQALLPSGWSERD